MDRRCFCTTLTTAWVAAALPAPAQDRQIIDIAFDHSLQVNGQRDRVTAQGFAELRTGLMIIDVPTGRILHPAVSSDLSDAPPSQPWLADLQTSPANVRMVTRITRMAGVTVTSRFKLTLADAILRVRVETTGTLTDTTPDSAEGRIIQTPHTLSDFLAYSTMTHDRAAKGKTRIIYTNSLR
ncbi:hypothetical protein [Actibacterium sp. 188UL27-1]|uniref:hypothetical protein n=1 Tax=Actibacterium sp. 188UL27-1 TaxID=2786961 RepID=UPI00195D4F11|nr:hypothetical protein [Actibacterium sp. 188UL27-1]MBM7070113.1 hypothetical protein [Actibacterium sp. 188UL27-1]